MHPLRQLSLIEQTAEHLRTGFRKGHWSGLLPGVRRLATELTVSKDTVEAALRLLESEGSLKSGGPGRRREIVLPRDGTSKRILRVAVLLEGPLDSSNAFSQLLMMKLVRKIQDIGHVCFIADRSQNELGFKVQRIAAMVDATKADAWVVLSAPLTVLKWFLERGIRVLAFGGRCTNLPVAASTTDLTGVFRDTVKTLTNHGHRRIVAITPSSWREPTMSLSAERFTSALLEFGHSATSYNLPSWDDTPRGLVKLLESLFKITPPTAIIFVDSATYLPALAFFARQGQQIPRDVSVVSMLPDPCYILHHPPMACFEWPMDQHIQRIVRWVKCLAMGGTDNDQIRFQPVLDPGGTIGPAKNP